jgi:Tol biopolymer transport system component
MTAPVRLSCLRMPYLLPWALLLVPLGCDSSGPDGVGSLEVHTLTSGDSPDPDGYQVTVDNVEVATVPATGVVTITDQPAGSRSVRLVGVAEHCAVGGDNPEVVVVAAGEIVTADFSVTCGTPMGSVRVQVTTTGDEIDPDGYQVFAGFGPAPIPSNGSIVMGVPAGDSEILLDGIAANCVFVGDNRIGVTVPAQGEVQVDFAISCIGPLLNDIAFVAQQANDPRDIFRANANGTRVQKLTMSPDEEFTPSWSPDGSRIAFFRGGEVMVMNADGSNVVDLGLVGSGLAWSPDGSQLAVTDRDLFIVNSDGTGLTNLTNRTCFPTTECGRVGSPSWSPDGTRIVYAFSRGFPPARQCYVINSDGTGNTLIKDLCKVPAWSPDGNAIAFVGVAFSIDEPEGPINLMKVDGSNVTELSAGLTGTSPAWSPDGAQLAFVSSLPVPEEQAASGPKVFVIHADGTGLRHVTLASEFTLPASPTWSPSLP